MECWNLKKIDNYYKQKAKEFKILERYLMCHHIINERKLNFFGERNLLDLEVEEKNSNCHENISYTFKSKNQKLSYLKKYFEICVN